MLRQRFDIPAHQWFRESLKPLLQDTLTKKGAREAGLRWEAIEALMQAHFDRRANHGYPLWGLLTLFLWIRRWNIQTSGSEAAALAKSSLS